MKSQGVAQRTLMEGLLKFLYGSHTVSRLLREREPAEEAHQSIVTPKAPVVNDGYPLGPNGQHRGV